MCAQHHRSYHRCETDDQPAERRAPAAEAFSTPVDVPWSSAPTAQRAPWTTGASPQRPGLARRLAGTKSSADVRCPPGTLQHATSIISSAGSEADKTRVRIVDSVPLQ